jgi:hypothetical protein
MFILSVRDGHYDSCPPGSQKPSYASASVYSCFSGGQMSLFRSDGKPWNLTMKTELLLTNCSFTLNISKQAVYVQPSLQCKGNTFHIFWVCIYILIYPTCNAHVACPTIPYFSAFGHKRHDFRKKRLLNIKCVLSFFLQLLYEKFLILRRSEWGITINVHRSSCKVLVISVKF